MLLNLVRSTSQLGAACFLVLILAGAHSPAAAQTSMAAAAEPWIIEAGERESIGNLQAAVTPADHFRAFADSTVATEGGTIKTVGWPLVTTSFSQLFTSHAGFGNDGTGFGHHYAVNLLGNVSGKCLGLFALPAAFHQNERYKPAEPVSSLVQRLGHIAKHLMLTRSADGSHDVFNVSALPNAAFSAALSNLYQPPEQRTAADNAGRFGYNVLGFVIGDAYKEFQPDLRALADVIKSKAEKIWRKHA